MKVIDYIVILSGAVIRGSGLLRSEESLDIFQRTAFRHDSRDSSLRNPPGWIAPLRMTILFSLILLSSCCEPAQRNSSPTVLDSSYHDTAIKDAPINLNVLNPIYPASKPTDSVYYPVYSLDIKNTGAEADTFTLRFSRPNGGTFGSFGFALTAQQYVQPGETKTFRTYGPIPANSLDTAKEHYVDFYVKSADSVSVLVMKPQITIHYGQTPNGPEQCGSPGKDLSVDPMTLHR